MVVEISKGSSVSSLENIAQNYSGNGHSKLFERFYTKSGEDVYSMFEWELRTAEIKDKYGNIKFKQENVEVPKGWSDTATKIVASRYFKRKNVKEEYGGNSEGSEQSVKKLVHRVSHTLRSFGEEKKSPSHRQLRRRFEQH